MKIRPEEDTHYIQFHSHILLSTTPTWTKEKKKNRGFLFALVVFIRLWKHGVFCLFFFFGVLGKNENEQKKMTMEKHTSLCWFVYALQIMRSSNLFVLSCCGFSSNPCKPIDIPKSWIQNQKNCVGTKSKEENYWCLSTQKNRQIFEYKVKRQILEAKKEETPRT